MKSEAASTIAPTNPIASYQWSLPTEKPVFLSSASATQRAPAYLTLGSNGVASSFPPPVPLQNPSPLPLGGVEALDHDTIRALLLEARERTLTLVAPVSEDDMNRVHSSLMSPLVWDIGHIAAFEDLWLSHIAAGLDPLRPELMEVYDATETPREKRGDIPYLRLCEAYDYLAAVRERTFEVLERTDLSDQGGLLNGHGLVWDMIVRHEQQHNETMLQALKIAPPGPTW